MAVSDVDTRSPLDVARELAPLIRSYAEQIEAEREIPRPLFESLADAGLFRLVIPHSIGGRELDLPTYIQVIEELGKADASTAWAINQGGVFATYAARLPREIARKIWFETPRGVVANTPSPAATAIRVVGGYRVTGRMGFSTGCRHASWQCAYARILENGAPRRLPNGQLDVRYFFIPSAEAEINDTWHVRGLRGTGTHHFTVNDVFVPDERTFDAATAPIYEPGPLYVFPRTLLFACGDASVALGVARSSLDALIELAGGKTPRATPGKLRDQPMAQWQVGQAEAILRSARALLTLTVREVWDSVCATGEITIDQRVALRVAATHSIRLSADVVDITYNAAGASAVYESSPLQRNFQDIHVITQHLQSRLAHYEMVGRYYLGLEPDLDRL